MERKMKKNKFSAALVFTSFSVIGVVGFIGYTDFASAAINSETQKAASREGAGTVTEISFSKESTVLSEGAKKELHEAITKAGKGGEIKEVRVAAWSDQEYPQKGITLAGTQIDLAEKRAESVQAYLKQTLNVTEVSTINMAKRPSGIQKALNTPDAQAKNTLEDSGAAPTNSDQTGLFGLKGKASEVVVMIYYRK
jgi:hypothetical protein